jgi:hypothetical protein
VYVVALACVLSTSHLAFSADKPKGQEISRVIAKEITAAQKAMQASQWSEMIKDLEAAEQKSPLTTYDKKTIYDFKGFAYIKLSNLKAAEAAYEQAVATGGYTPEELTRTIACCSSSRRAISSSPRPSNTAKTARNLPPPRPTTF